MARCLRAVLLVTSATALPVAQSSTPASHTAASSALVGNDSSLALATDYERCYRGGLRCQSAPAPAASASSITTLLQPTAPLLAVPRASSLQPSFEPASLPPSTAAQRPRPSAFPPTSSGLATRMLVGRSVLEPAVPSFAPSAAPAPRLRYQISVPAGMSGGQVVQVTLPSGAVRVTIPANLKEGDKFVFEDPAPPPPVSALAPAQGEQTEAETSPTSKQISTQQNGGVPVPAPKQNPPQPDGAGPGDAVGPVGDVGDGSPQPAVVPPPAPLPTVLPPTAPPLPSPSMPPPPPAEGEGGAEGGAEAAVAGASEAQAAGTAAEVTAEVATEAAADGLLTPASLAAAADGADVTAVALAMGTGNHSMAMVNSSWGSVNSSMEVVWTVTVNSSAGTVNSSTEIVNSSTEAVNSSTGTIAEAVLTGSPPAIAASATIVGSKYDTNTTVDGTGEDVLAVADTEQHTTAEDSHRNKTTLDIGGTAAPSVGDAGLSAADGTKVPSVAPSVAAAPVESSLIAPDAPAVASAYGGAPAGDSTAASAAPPVASEYEGGPVETAVVAEVVGEGEELGAGLGGAGDSGDGMPPQDVSVTAEATLADADPGTQGSLPLSVDTSLPAIDTSPLSSLPVDILALDGAASSASAGALLPVDVAQANGTGAEDAVNASAIDAVNGVAVDAVNASVINAVNGVAVDAVNASAIDSVNASVVDALSASAIDGVNASMAGAVNASVTDGVNIISAGAIFSSGDLAAPGVNISLGFAPPAVSADDVPPVAVSADGVHPLVVSAGDVPPLAVSADDVPPLAVSADGVPPLAVSAGDVPPLAVSADDVPLTILAAVETSPLASVDAVAVPGTVSELSSSTPPTVSAVSPARKEPPSPPPRSEAGGGEWAWETSGEDARGGVRGDSSAAEQGGRKARGGGRTKGRGGKGGGGDRDITAGEGAPSAEVGEVTPPMGEVAPPTDEIAPPTDEIAPPTDEIAPPTDEIAPPTDEIAPPTDEIASPTDEIAPPTDEIAAPASEITAPASEVAPPSAEIDAPLAEVPPLAIGEVAPPTDEIAPPSEVHTPQKEGGADPRVDSTTTPTPGGLVTPLAAGAATLPAADVLVAPGQADTDGASALPPIQLVASTPSSLSVRAFPPTGATPSALAFWVSTSPADVILKHLPPQETAEPPPTTLTGLPPSTSLCFVAIPAGENWAPGSPAGAAACFRTADAPASLGAPPIYIGGWIPPFPLYGAILGLVLGFGLQVWLLVGARGHLSRAPAASSSPPRGAASRSRQDKNKTAEAAGSVALMSGNVTDTNSEPDSAGRDAGGGGLTGLAAAASAATAEFDAWFSPGAPRAPPAANRGRGATTEGAPANGGGGGSGAPPPAALGGAPPDAGFGGFSGFSGGGGFGADFSAEFDAEFDAGFDAGFDGAWRGGAGGVPGGALTPAPATPHPTPFATPAAAASTPASVPGAVATPATACGAGARTPGSLAPCAGFAAGFGSGTAASGGSLPSANDTPSFGGARTPAQPPPQGGTLAPASSCQQAHAAGPPSTPPSAGGGGDCGMHGRLGAGGSRVGEDSGGMGGGKDVGVEVLRSEGLIVRVSVSGAGVVDGGCVVTLCYGNDAPTPVTNLTAQVAVPKHLRMRLDPPSATSLPPEPLPGYGPTLPPITQALRLSQVGGPPYKPVKVRLRLAYDRAGEHVVEEATIGPESFGQA